MVNSRDIAGNIEEVEGLSDESGSNDFLPCTVCGRDALPPLTSPGFASRPVLPSDLKSCCSAYCGGYPARRLA